MINPNAPSPLSNSPAPPALSNEGHLVASPGFTGADELSGERLAAQQMLTGRVARELPPSRTPTQLAWRELRKNRLAVWSLWMLGAFYFIALFVQFFAPFDYQDQSPQGINASYHPPRKVRFRDALEMTLKLNPAFLDGSADRALGRWYFKVPGLFGGSNKKSEEHLRKSITYGANRVISHLFLADTLADMGRHEEARKEYQAAIDAPFDPDWTPEDRRFKEQAKRALQQR